MSLVKEFLQTPNVWIGVGEKIKIRNKKWCSINTTQPSKGKQNYQCSLFCTNTKLLFSAVEKKKCLNSLLPCTRVSPMKSLFKQTVHLQWFKTLTFYFQFAINFCLSKFVDCSAGVSASIIWTGFADLQGTDTLVAEHSVPWVIHYNDFVFQPGYFGLW